MKYGRYMVTKVSVDKIGNFRKSINLKRKAEKLIPSCSQTFSKSYTQFVEGRAPVFVKKAKGSHLWDIDNNKFLDYAMALGPVILGYNNGVVNSAVKKTLSMGTVFSLPHELEYELSRLLTRCIPCAEMVRFGKNGSDATSGAVRLARAYTGRDKIACCGYHGWQDWYIGTTTRNKGVPGRVISLTKTFTYNDIGTLERIFAGNKKQVACVIMEPVGIERPKSGFLRDVRSLAPRNGALLIFDEVITGFRMSLGGAQEYFNVVPDLACFGKAMGNGFPISAVVGRKEIMSLFDEVFYSFTFGGEILSIAAAIATIKEIKHRKVIPYVWRKGAEIKDGYNALTKEYGLEKYTRCIGFPPRTVIKFRNRNGEDDLLLKSLFQQECIKLGVLFTGGHMVSLGHSEKDIRYTMGVYRRVLDILRDAIDKKNVPALLEGRAVQPIFRKA